METETPGSRQAPRVWLLAALGVAFVALIAYQMWPERQPSPTTTTSSNRGRSGRQNGPGTLDPAELKVRLDALNAARPDPGEGERNPFRFKPAPAPPPSAASKLPPVAEAPVPTGPPPPPPIPPIPLKFMGTVERGNMKLAALTDCKGFTFAAHEGETGIDGRYKLVRIQNESIVMEYVNGTGRTTIRKSGECPR
jgi:hypothetical protein